MFGLKFLWGASSDKFSEASRFVIGPAVEWRMTPKIAVELDVIFQSADLIGGVSSVSIFSASSWQIDTSIRYFPVLAKYRFLTRSITPFAIAGGAIRSFSHAGTLRLTTVSPGGLVGSTTSPITEAHTDVGWAVGGGVEFKLNLLRISPELRYMRFGDFACDRCTNAIPSLSVNPVVLMLGIGF